MAFAPRATYATTALGSAVDPTYGVCEFASTHAYGGNEFNPSGIFLELLPKDFRDRVRKNSLSQKDWDTFSDWEKHVSLQVLTPPRHGKVSPPGLLSYFANDGYIGKDRIEVIVSGQDLNGHEISMKLIYFINVVRKEDFHSIADNYDQSLAKFCHVRREFWRISRTRGANGARGNLPWSSSSPVTWR
jgi:hypothetical protein